LVVPTSRATVAAVRERLARQPHEIAGMFAGVAARYDLLNRTLSLRRDVRWRRRLIEALTEAPPGPVLDVGTGTGDVALAATGRTVIGLDFCLDMLALARAKASRRAWRLPLAAGDALQPPLRERSFAAVTAAFTARNFSDLDRGLDEIRRLLVPGGMVAILELQRPPGRAAALLGAAWNRCVVTPLGRLLSGDGAAYAYLPASVSTFPDGRGLAARPAVRGFVGARSEDLTGGFVALTTARRGKGP
jgi:demethylmenaquinone methyltransferase/2-methoxy-6-polyprenyl-1,4-benzoquinol methylase